MSLEPGSIFIAFIYKAGLAKFIGLGASLIGAGVMALMRPPRTRKELFFQALVALAGSLLFGGFAVHAVSYYANWTSLSYETIGAIHGLIGALSWGIFGALAILREKLSTDPIQVAKDIKEIL